MALLGGLFLLSSALLVPADSLPWLEPEASGAGADGPLQLGGRMLPQAFFRRGLSSRPPFPSFLARGRPAPRTPVGPLQLKGPVEPLRKKQSMQMWQKVALKGGKTRLPQNLKDPTQTCTAVPFTQHVTADGCQPAAVHNKLCFGQCSSLFVPSEGEFAGLAPWAGAFHRRAPCSRCAPVRARAVTVALRCGTEVRGRRVLLVEECKCETGRQERGPGPAAHAQL